MKEDREIGIYHSIMWQRHWANAIKLELILTRVRWMKLCDHTICCFAILVKVDRPIVKNEEESTMHRDGNKIVFGLTTKHRQ